METVDTMSPPLALGRLRVDSVGGSIAMLAFAAGLAGWTVRVVFNRPEHSQIQPGCIGAKIDGPVTHRPANKRVLQPPGLPFAGKGRARLSTQIGTSGEHVSLRWTPEHEY